MIKTLKSSTVRKITNQDISNLTIFKIRFGTTESKQYENTVNLNFSPDTIVYWGDGEVNTEPTHTDIYNSNYQHTYTDEFISENPIITIICEGYPVQDSDKVILSNYNPLGSGLLYQVDHLSNKTKSAFGLFANAKQLIEINENVFEGTDIKNFNNCFYKSGLTVIPEKLFKYAGEDATFNRAFSECQNLVESNLIFNCPKAWSFREFTFLFENCVKLKTINASMFKGIDKNSSLFAAFKGCKDIVIPPGLLDGQVKPYIMLLFKSCDLKVDDFIGDTIRIPLDLFANLIYEYEYRTIFEKSVEPDEKEKIIEAEESEPDKFKFQFKDGIVPFSWFLK